MALTLPDLPYAEDALAPVMSAETIEYHYGKHHQAYVTNGNKLMEGTEFAGMSVEDVVTASHGSNAGVFNNVAQHYNHCLFWNIMKPDGGGRSIPGKLAAMIDSDLGGYDRFRTDFIQAGVTQFGSGWAWLSVKDGKLEISKTPNGENPLLTGATPIIGCDVWEHSYYIDYRNARPAYLEAFVDNLIDWDAALANLEAA